MLLSYEIITICDQTQEEMFLVNQHAYCYIVNNRHDLFGPENMGMDTKIDFFIVPLKGMGHVSSGSSCSGDHIVFTQEHF